MILGRAQAKRRWVSKTADKIRNAIEEAVDDYEAIRPLLDLELKRGGAPRRPNSESSGPFRQQLQRLIHVPRKSPYVQLCLAAGAVKYM